MPEVRVTMFQHPITVDDDEVDTLRSQGLLIEDKPAEDKPAGVTPEPPGVPAGGKPKENGQ